MAYRDRSTKGRPDGFDFCVMRITVMGKSTSPAGDARTLLLTVDNHLETIRFVQKNLENCVDNVVRI